MACGIGMIPRPYGVRTCTECPREFTPKTQNQLTCDDRQCKISRQAKRTAKAVKKAKARKAAKR